MDLILCLNAYIIPSTYVPSVAHILLSRPSIQPHLFVFSERWRRGSSTIHRLFPIFNSIFLFAKLFYRLGAPANIRCPRCDSSNTKFCYYNNYNLTQPRHFCKTCRRYWTKGGALRNVPIGGGCRKVKPCRSATAKPKPAIPILAALDHELQSPATALWNPPYSSQLLDLIRSSQFQNPNPNLRRIKADSSIFSPQLAAEPAGAMYDQGLGLDSLGQLSISPYNSLWRNGGNQYPYHQQQAPQQHNMFMGEMQSPSGIQELLQRLKTSSSYNYGSLSSSVDTSVATSSTTTAILEPIPLSGGDVGYWNPSPLSWADLQTTNGGFP